MANRTIFQTSKVSRLPKTNTINRAGGTAYSMSNAEALAQYVVTGTFNGTYYTSSDQHLATVQALVENVSPELIAKAAIYGREKAYMKDMPAYLAAVLAARGELSLLRKVFPRVVTDLKMLLNFVQIIRSGVTGRKSFGSAVKSLIQKWLIEQDTTKLFTASFGHSNPSLADVIKMVHPKADCVHRNALFAYIIGKPYKAKDSITLVNEFETFKKDSEGKIPSVPFQALSNINMDVNQWKELGRNMPWNQMRMNLNTLARHGVFDDVQYTKEIANKLSDENLITRTRVFPYQLLTTYQNTEALPTPISVALSDAMEIATKNVPSFNYETAVCMDSSGSMQSPVTGHRLGSTTKTTCQEVAALIGSCIARNNPSAKMIQFDTCAREVKINPRDSIMTNAQRLACNGGGTDCSCALRLLNQNQTKANLVIYVSDNESWYGHNGLNDYFGRNRSTPMVEEWTKFKGRNPKAKLVCIDIIPNTTIQTPNDKDVLNIGGFSDNIWDVIKNFVNNEGEHFINVINEIDI